jgi:hypothetical protein
MSTEKTVQVVARVTASLLGSYALVWGFVSLGIPLGVASGMRYEDSQTLLFLLAFLLFVACFCWAFTAPSVLRVWLCFLGGGSFMTFVGWLLAGKLA